MLHQMQFIGILNALCHQTAFDVSLIDKVTLKITVSPGYHGFSDKSVHFHEFTFRMDF